MPSPDAAREPARWYFDVVSPFAYLHWHLLAPLRPRLAIEPVPVLFAGLLKHWGTIGPAELPTKRRHTYEFCAWVAHRHGVPFRMPPRHPFNPLPAQRLLVATGASDDDVTRAFDFVFAQGRDPEHEWPAFAAALGVADADARIADPEVKARLAEHTRAAIEQGVFGVPTLALRGHLFWGSDTVEWTLAYLDDPALFDRPGFRSAADCAPGVLRRR